MPPAFVAHVDTGEGKPNYASITSSFSFLFVATSFLLRLVCSARGVCRFDRQDKQHKLARSVSRKANSRLSFSLSLSVSLPLSLRRRLLSGSACRLLPEHRRFVCGPRVCRVGHLSYADAYYTVQRGSFHDVSYPHASTVVGSMGRLREYYPFRYLFPPTHTRSLFSDTSCIFFLSNEATSIFFTFVRGYKAHQHVLRFSLCAHTK